MFDRHRWRSMAAVALLACAGLTLAQDGGRARRGGGDRPDPFARFDTDGDGKITRDEWKGPPQLFDRLDADKDGVITREEAQKARRGMRRNLAEHLKQMDANADGKISRQEWRGQEQGFDRLDANKDGEISQDEIQAAQQRMAGRDGRGQRGRGPGDRRQGNRRPGVPPFFMLIDKDKDKKITSEELQAFVQEFRKADANNDGAVDEQEFMAFMRKHMPQPPQGARGQGPEGRRGRGGPGRRGGPGAGGVPGWFERMDANSDGRVSPDEFTGAEDLFKELDANSDGFIDKTEASQRGQRGRGREGRGGRQGQGGPPVDF